MVGNHSSEKEAAVFKAVIDDFKSNNTVLVSIVSDTENKAKKHVGLQWEEKDLMIALFT